MMQENNLLNKNSTNDIQGVKSNYALVILISSIETENQLSYCGSTIDISTLAWSKLTRFCVTLFIFTSIYPLAKRLNGLAVERCKMKRLLN